MSGLQALHAAADMQATRALRAPRAAAVRLQARRAAATVAAARSSEHAVYLESVARSAAPAGLAGLLRLLVAQGGELLPPTQRRGMHPLVVPLASSADGSVVGLLRWASPPEDAFPLPVVRLSHPTAACLTPLARSVGEALHRALVEEAATGISSGPLRLAAEEALSAVGELLPFSLNTSAAAAAGEAPRGRHAPLDAHLSKSCGRFADVCERLIAGHLAADDLTAALVTSDWYGNQLAGWAQPKAHATQLLTRLGRGEEARDAAVGALAGGAPLWTMEASLVQPTREAAGVAGRPVGWLKAQLEARGRPGGAAAAAAGMSETTAAEKSAERAGVIMDEVAAGERAGGWSACAEELAVAWEGAGRPELAALARGVA